MEQNTLDLLQLPDEVLRYVLSFIPYRFEVSQVCKKFYELVCDMDKNKYMLKVRTNHWRGEVRIKTNQFDDLQNIFKQFILFCCCRNSKANQFSTHSDCLTQSTLLYRLKKKKMLMW